MRRRSGNSYKSVCDTLVLELQLDVIHFHGNEAGNDAVDVSFHRGISPGSIGARGTTYKIVSSLQVENDKRFRVMGDDAGSRRA